MLRYLLVFALVLPFADMYILFQITQIIGFWQTLVIVLATGLVGAEIVRREGRHVLRKLQHSVTGGEISRNVVEGGLLLLAGIFLVSPGLVTDVIGFMLAFRPLRERLVAKAVSGNSVHVQVGTF